MDALPPISGIPDPQQAASLLQAKVAIEAAVKVKRIQADMGQALIALLDPNVGRRLNVSA